MSQSTATSCIVRVYDQRDYQGQVTVRWSNAANTTFELHGTDKWLVSQPITLPVELKDIHIDGTLTWESYASGKHKSSGSTKSVVVDFTPALQPLRSQESWGKRMGKFVKELTKLEKQYAEPDASPSQWIKPNHSASGSEITTAERRLNFALPVEHKQLLQDYGAWSVSDSFCVAIEDIDRADKQMRSIWGSPASEFTSLSVENQKLYRESVMLFVEAGDGYGALIYHPTGSGGEYYWIHQDDLDRPDKLLDSRSKLRDYSSSMLWLIANQILVSYEDAFPEHIFIDRSSPIPIPYQMRIGFGEQKQLETVLNVEWSKFE